MTKTKTTEGSYDGIVIVPKRGKFMARVWMPDGAGGGKYRCKVKSTEAAAEEWAKDEKAKLRTGAETAGTSAVAELAPLYLEQLALRGTSHTHRAQVDRVFAILRAAGATDLRDAGFETKALRAFTHHEARRHNQVTATKASPNYQRKLLAMAKGFTKWATDRGHVGRNPLAGARLAKPERSSKETWTYDELRLLVSDAARRNQAQAYLETEAVLKRHKGSKMAAARELKLCPATIYNRLNAGRPEDDRLWLPAVLGLYLGARPTEIRHMTWGMIDWKAGDGDGHLVLPANTPGNKTKSERRVRLMHELRAILKPKAGVGTGRIVAPSIAKMTDSVYTNAFKHYCERLGVSVLGPHTLRHCCGSLMTAMGIQPVQVLLQLGHDSPIVSKRYSESAPKYREAKGWGDQFRLREKAAPAVMESTRERDAR